MGDVEDQQPNADTPVESGSGIETSSAVSTAGPSRGTLAATSLAAFTGLLVVGGLFGWLASPGDVDPRASVALADQLVDPQSTADEMSQNLQLEFVDQALVVVDIPVVDTAAVDTALFDTAVADASLLAATPTTSPPPATTTEAPTTTTTTTAEEPAAIEVLGVTELGLELSAPESTSTETIAPDGATDSSGPADVVFVELPKAVYDTFVLGLGESLAINIAANDKIGGQFEGVRPTGLGDLAPGFTLESNGVLSGIANECGRWRLQYALVSDNPAVGTSWIDITVEGCDELG